MSSPIFLSSLAPFLDQFVQYKRALNRKYCADAEVLRLFDRYVHSRHIAGWSAIDSLVIDDFLRSHRRRVSPRSYNHLLGTVRRFFAFAVMQQWIERNPVTAASRPSMGPVSLPSETVIQAPTNAMLVPAQGACRMAAR